MYKIEKNVPMNNHSKYDFPFDKMAINDSFLIPKSEIESEQLIRQVISNKATTYKIKIKKDFKVSVRKQKEGFRVWRIK